MSARREKQVERVVAIDQAAFLADYRSICPVVLSGGLTNRPDTLFDMERLADRFGAEHVWTYKVPRDAASFRMSSIKARFHVWSDEEGEREHLHGWTFGEFVAALRNGEPHYCMANTTKNRRLRDLMAAEAGDPGCVPVSYENGNLVRREFFLGSEHAGPGLHHDGAIESFLCQLIGTKRVNLFAPSDIPYLYPAASWLALSGHFSAVPDSFNVDSGKYPLFGMATVHTCLLDPGDVLYIPPYWHHDTAPRGPTVSMTIRNQPPPEVWGTVEDRSALERAAQNLYACLDRLPLEARTMYRSLLGRDLTDDT